MSNPVIVISSVEMFDEWMAKSQDLLLRKC